MIRLVEATPGSGKTCLVIEWLLREIDKGFYKEFYSNIADLKVCGVRPLPEDCDWRQLNPDKDPDQPPKLVIVDEAQYIEAFMKENRSVSNRIGKDLSTHRHYGLDIWLITQSSKLLNDYVLANVGEHVYLYRPRKKKSVRVYWWSHVQKSLNKTSFKSADDEQTWRLNPNIFALYKSTANVTDAKARQSTKLNSVLITAAVIFAYIGYTVFSGVGDFEKMRYGTADAEAKTVATVDPASIAAKVSDPAAVQQQAAQQQAAPAALPAAAQQQAAPALHGVMMMGDKCLAYANDGSLLDIPRSECLRAVDYAGVVTKAVPSPPSPIG